MSACKPFKCISLPPPQDLCRAGCYRDRHRSGSWLLAKSQDPPDGMQSLVLVLLLIVVHHVEEPQLVVPLARAHDSQPVPELLLLEELLSTEPESITHCPLSQAQSQTHRYLRYRPENSMWVTTSILPAPAWLIFTASPRLPTRPSTLILSCRNFSNAETSKILSWAGWAALMVNLTRNGQLLMAQGDAGRWAPGGGQ